MPIYGRMTIFEQNANSHNFLTVHNRNINLSALPMFSWSANKVKIFKRLVDGYFGLCGHTAKMSYFSHCQRMLIFRLNSMKEALIQGC